MSGELWREEGLVAVLGPSGDGGLSPWASPLAALPRMASAWEMSREGAVKSSSRHMA